jgi:hypothetical protein
MASKWRHVKTATQTIKGMYVNTEMTDMIRQRYRHDRASTHRVNLPPSKQGILDAGTHQTRFVGRPTEPPSLYQSPQRPASAARAKQHRATRAGRARERDRITKPARASRPPPPSGSVAPTLSPCAAEDDEDHACDTRKKGGRWMGRGALQAH